MSNNKCKPFVSSEANAKAFLRTKGAIDKFLNILDLNKFRNLNSELLQQAKQYIPDFSEKLFYEENGGKKALPNTQAFKNIDNAKGLYYSLKPDSQVNYILKSANALQSDKVRNPKNNLQGFYNDLQKQGVPNQQIEIIKSLNPENKTKEELLTELLANYSYTIEINQGKGYKYDIYGEDGDWRVYDGDRDVAVYETLEEAKNHPGVSGTNYYSNLTVPGGTLYQENEISTPLITPSIKGHAQFSTDSGIGWGRWDDKVNYTMEDADKLIDILEKSGQLKIKCD